MRVEVQAVAPEEVEADVLAVPLVAEDGLGGAAQKLDGGLDGLLSRFAGEGELRDELGRASIVHVDGRLRAPRIAAVGVGDRDHIDADALRTAAAAVTRAAAEYAERIAWAIDDSLPLSPADQTRALVDGTMLGGYEPARWKQNDPPPKLSTLVICGAGDGLDKVAQRAATVAAWTNRAPDPANSPPTRRTPEGLAERARAIASPAGHLTADSLDPDEIREQGMGALAAVAQGRHTPHPQDPLPYDPPVAKAALVLGLVGNAITFDTGGDTP